MPALPGATNGDTIRARFSASKGVPQMTAPEQVTQLLLAWNQGDASALERLIPLVYAELRRLAHHYMAKERRHNTLQTTVLINEVYLRLIDSSKVRWQDRAHFLAVSAQLMRRVLVDFARSRGYQKRGGQALQIPLEEALTILHSRSADLVALDEALKELAAVAERKSQVVEMRFFGGLSVEETAEVLKVSPDTVMRDWKFAKSWLLRQLSKES
ncbi:MAG TPA: sigma-70 family RNA polymerase sigma factor [Pyrinomonadaceae bacterium]|nr:sigma-70 family RNA polymerase sigma factor [Pyrinomonadaceae bacterium]